MIIENINSAVAFLLDVKEDSIKDCIFVQDVLDELTKTVLTGTEIAIIRIVRDLYRIMLSTNDKEIKIGKDDLLRIISAKMDTIFMSEWFNTAKAIEQEEIQLNLKDPKDVEEGINYFYTRISDEMDNIYEIKERGISYTQVLFELDSLKATIIRNLYEEKLIKTQMTYSTSGTDKAIQLDKEYAEKIRMISEIDVSGSANNQEVFLDSKEKADEYRQKFSNYDEILFDMELTDDPMEFPVMVAKYIVIVAEVNAGKTRFLIDQTYKALMSGVNVALFPTETVPLFSMRDIELAHFYRTHKRTTYPFKEMSMYDEADENTKRHLDVIRDAWEYAKTDLYENKKYGKLFISENLSYENCREKFIEIHKKFGVRLFVVDHTKGLIATGEKVNGVRLLTLKEQLTYLSRNMYTLKKELMSTFLVASHPSSEYSSGMKNERIGSATNLTAGAIELSADADEMYYLFTSIEMKELDRIGIAQAKVRGKRKHSGRSIILQRLGDCNAHIYLPDIQENDNYTEKISDITDIEEE